MNWPWSKGAVMNAESNTKEPEDAEKKPAIDKAKTPRAENVYVSHTEIHSFSIASPNGADNLMKFAKNLDHIGPLYDRGIAYTPIGIMYQYNPEMTKELEKNEQH